MPGLKQNGGGELKNHHQTSKNPFLLPPAAPASRSNADGSAGKPPPYSTPAKNGQGRMPPPPPYLTPSRNGIRKLLPKKVIAPRVGSALNLKHNVNGKSEWYEIISDCQISVETPAPH